MTETDEATKMDTTDVGEEGKSIEDSDQVKKDVVDAMKETKTATTAGEDEEKKNDGKTTATITSVDDGDKKDDDKTTKTTVDKDGVVVVGDESTDEKDKVSCFCIIKC